MAKFCDNNRINVFDILPITFVIDYANKYNFESAFDKFQVFFNIIERNKTNGIQAIN